MSVERHQFSRETSRVSCGGLEMMAGSLEAFDDGHPRPNRSEARCPRRSSRFSPPSIEIRSGGLFLALSGIEASVGQAASTRVGVDGGVKSLLDRPSKYSS